MKKLFFIASMFLIASSFPGCRNYAQKKLNRQMEPLAKKYLQEENITHYDWLRINQVDTITELGYAKLMYELLENMEQSYQKQYDDAVLQEKEGQHLDILDLYLREISRTKIDFFDLMANDDLKTNGLLLFMVTGSYQTDGQTDTVLFFVNPDKRTLHTLDPFGNNLLYQDK